MRIGHGFDVHAFTTGDHLWLGGVRIEHTHAVRAHSDGDVVLHALMDALLGAIAYGDIGQHFPDTEARFRDVPSSELLAQVLAFVQARHLHLSNLDVTVICETPPIAPHRSAIIASLSQQLSLDVGCIGFKATTHEGIGALGRGEGIAAHVGVLLDDD